MYRKPLFVARGLIRLYSIFQHLGKPVFRVLLGEVQGIEGSGC